MRIIFTGLLVMLSFTAAFTQKYGRPLIDSLYGELERVREDTVRVRILSTICYELRNINPREALKILQSFYLHPQENSVDSQLS